LSVTQTGEVFVADAENYRIQYFTPTGGFLDKWGSVGSHEGEFRWPSDVAVGPNGDVYVTDFWNDRVQRFVANGDIEVIEPTPDYEYAGEWGGIGDGPGQFRKPYDVGVSPNGDVYVVEWGNDRIQYFSEKGTHIGTWGKKGALAGEFEFPTGLTVAPAGYVYVADRGNGRVQRFSGVGTFIGEWKVWGWP
jgi:DNA-binding beta-propeller fold protein YncE